MCSTGTPQTFWILGNIHSMAFHDGNTCLGEVCILITAQGME